ncbi:Oligoxyloglucan reducing end-specific cellobiohydrolase [Mycena latifolia]|nr:Oligoxyloglucan reducing end-specific cellobiohydrolase [Mycena latifolia]
MRRYSIWAAFLLFISLPYQLLATPPEHSITSFPNSPTQFFFFGDSTSAVYHDSIERNIYVSSDEGNIWTFPAEIPRGVAEMVIEHPFDTSQAFILTRSTIHFRTADRGKSWRAFEMPIPPAIVASPFSFHSHPQKHGYILYQGTVCDKVGRSGICHDETYVTKDAFSSTPRRMLSDTSRCQFAHSHFNFNPPDVHPDLVYCVAFDTRSPGDDHERLPPLLLSSTDFFERDHKVEEFGIGKHARGVIAFRVVSNFAVVALQDPFSANRGALLLYVTRDTKTWVEAQFPHPAKLHEGGFTIVESRTDSLAVDIADDHGAIGTLFVSDSNGTFFVQTLKSTNRDEMGVVNYEPVYSVEGFGLANVVTNAEYVEGRGEPKRLKSLITFDDGSSWTPIRAPRDRSAVPCDPDDAESCSFNLYHNLGQISGSMVPGLLVATGSVGNFLLPYEQCNTFLSTDGGITWNMILRGAHKLSFGDSGSILVAVPDEEGVNHVRYSLNSGQTWEVYNFGVRLKPLTLTPSRNSGSPKFLLVGQVGRRDQSSEVGPYVTVYLDISSTRKRKCTDEDFEVWYAWAPGSECIMGHKQRYKRRKPDTECYVGQRLTEPDESFDYCACTDADYECDYNYNREGDACVSVGPDKILAGACKTSRDSFMGSSGYRKVPGNVCTGGTKDRPVLKSCSPAHPGEGDIVHQQFIFPGHIIQHAYFRGSATLLVRLTDNSIWQSSNEGYSWTQMFPAERFLAFYHHKYNPGRAYLITTTNKIYSTTDSGRTWRATYTPTPPNTFRAQILRFHPDSDKLIWTGNKDCDTPLSPNCHAEAQYSRDNGRRWNFVENYVVNCAWMMDISLVADRTAIVCESYQNKTGSQRFFLGDNPLALVEGSSYFTEKTKLFDQVIGSAKFAEYWMVAELLSERHSLDLQISLGGPFATAMFPPALHPETHAYTVLQSFTGSLFIHMTTSEPPHPYWGTILKSNSNGTYFGISINNVNRDERGFVDFEKIIGIDGIAFVNVVANPQEAVLTGQKALQTRITHTDGATWKPLMPPLRDSHGNKYECQSTACALHLHGYTGRTRPEATYSSEAIVGVLIAVGNVGELLAPYDQSNTFLSRDAGFTWEEIRKDPHIWEFGDSGSILVMTSATGATDHVLFSTNEGLNWHEYQFSDRKVQVRSIVTAVPATSRLFILTADDPLSYETLIVYLDFSSLTSRQCAINIDNPGQDDFELWSPADERQERCMFGRQVLYHRRVREFNCVVGHQPISPETIIRNCACIKTDFECEFNYYKNEADECVLIPGATPLPNDDSCIDEDYWYERTAYRRISWSSCEGGENLDQGIRHRCPSNGGAHQGGYYLWFLAAMGSIIFVLFVAYWCYTICSAPRNIQLPEDSSATDASRTLDNIKAFPVFLLRIAGAAWAWTIYRFRSVFQKTTGPINLSMDEDS